MIREFAPAKINLYLHVTGRRDDGYHTLDSAVVFADIGDELEIKPADTFGFSADGPFHHAINNPDNLVVQAAKKLAEKYGRDLDVQIKLTKNLPIASGVGGGSSDAAAALRGLMRYWNIKADVTDIALSLGADVPACLSMQPQHMRGIGEHLEAIDFPPTPILLVNPKKPCLTNAVFKKFDASHKQDIPVPETLTIDFLSQQDNVLTPAACQIVPEISAVLEALHTQEHCVLARLCGSGATCFGLFKTPKAAQNAAQKIQGLHHDWWVKAGQTLPCINTQTPEFG